MNLADLTIKGAALMAFVAFLAAVRWARGRKNSEKTFRFAYHAMTALLGMASVYLMVAILTHDFRYDYVVGYSSRDLPLIYLISAFWAGQQGTLLLWALFAALLGYSLIRDRSWEPATVMSFYLPTIGFLFALMLNPSGNPFRLANQAVADGRGLNPLLQDPWMASHPPVVFLGYAAMTIPAVLALTALIRGGKESWLRPALRWSLIAFVFLGIGIILGGFWAYKVLGWGGYWGWDPVENASLVPWLVVTALLHGILLQRGTGGVFRRTNFALAISGFLLVLYSTFLTRSGVLAEFSVHSFPEGTIYRLLMMILLVSGGTGLYLFLRHRGPGGRPIPIHLSWPLIQSLLIVLFTLSAIVILLGTSWPMLSSLMGKPAALRPDFYNQTNLPIYILLLGLLGIGPFLAWTARPRWFLVIRLAVPIALASAGTWVAFALGGRGTGTLLLFFTALLAMAANLIRVVQVSRVRLLQTGAAIAHIGFALMFAGIVASSSWGTSTTIRLPRDQGIEVLGRTMIFQGHVAGSEPEDRWRITIQEGDGTVETAEVTMYRQVTGGEPGQVFRRPAILRYLTGDLYIAPQDLEVVDGRDRLLELVRGQPAQYEDATLTYQSIESSPAHSGQGMTVRVPVQVQRGDREETVVLSLTVDQEGLKSEWVPLDLLPGVILYLERMAVEQNKIFVLAGDPNSVPSQTLTAVVSTKPLIGVLWLGTILLSLGCTMAIVRRTLEEKILGPEKASIAARRQKTARPALAPSPLRRAGAGIRGRISG